MAKQFEYMTREAVWELYHMYKDGKTMDPRTMDPREYIEACKKCRNTTFNEFINKLGKEGWEFFPDEGGVFGKREIPQERYNSHSGSISR